MMTCYSGLHFPPPPKECTLPQQRIPSKNEDQGTLDVSSIKLEEILVSTAPKCQGSERLFNWARTHSRRGEALAPTQNLGSALGCTPLHSPLLPTRAVCPPTLRFPGTGVTPFPGKVGSLEMLQNPFENSWGH